jgi:fimbrial chaperone protein
VRCLALSKSLQASALAGLWLLCGPAAAQLVIGPTVVEFGAKQKVVAVSVTLDDRAAAPMRLQADVQRWQQDLAGDAITTETSELMVTPPVAEIRPGQKQIFRLALRGQRNAAEELAYRLILEDISETTASAEIAPNMNVNFRMRYDLPVMLAPVNAVSNRLQWKTCPTEIQPSAHACVRILNAGNRRVKIQNLALAGNGWQHSVSFKEGINVLSGAEREWRILLQPGQTGTLRNVQVYTARGEAIDAQAGGF